MSKQDITWKVVAIAFAIVAWAMVVGICGWNLHETIRLGQEVARVETRLDMTPISKANRTDNLAKQ